MIEVKNLVKDYGKHHAVKDISFSVPDGQIVGLLGTKRCRKVYNNEYNDRIYFCDFW